ncbi:MAG TPA: hypothetical protein VK435_08570 [Thermodesulfovibrionales bacterium]|nr:hypothetical protein [Thermodesulfovibrionales bacterium]
MKSFAVITILMLCLLVSAVEKSASAGEPAEKKQAVSSLTGKVVETMDSGRYTYLLLENKDKKVWVAVYKMKVAVGEKVSLKPGIEMVNFESKTLNRKFDKIIFSEGPVSPTKTADEKKSK